MPPCSPARKAGAPAEWPPTCLRAITASAGPAVLRGVELNILAYEGYENSLEHQPEPGSSGVDQVLEGCPGGPIVQGRGILTDARWSPARHLPKPPPLTSVSSDAPAASASGAASVRGPCFGSACMGPGRMCETMFAPGRSALPQGPLP